MITCQQVRNNYVINKQLLDEVFVICRFINVEVSVISRANGEADNSYRYIKPKITNMARKTIKNN